LNDKPDDDKSIGYGKPPKHTQFKKGQSGNPSGKRKKKTANPDPNPVRQFLLRDVVTTSGGSKKKMTIIAAMINKYAGMAMSGDYRAAKLIFDNCGDLDTMLLWKPDNPGNS
jgi:hypothetical protein